ncbi:MAG: hypothetical protein ACK5E3_12825 [Planctomycetota bacterium]
MTERSSADRWALALAVNTVNDVTNAAAVRRRGKWRYEQRPPVADARVLDGIDLIDGIDGIDCGQD